jgi:serpin B
MRSGLSLETIRLIEAHQGFAARLYGEVARGNPGNLGLSPYSIAHVLTLLLGGTTGATHVGIRKALGYDPDAAYIHRSMSELRSCITTPAPRSVLDHRFETADALWLQRGWRLQSSFATLVEQHYPGQVHQVDYQNDPDAAVATINAWVEERTHERITNLIPSTSDSTRIILTIAVWLKAEWQKPFLTQLTRPGPFTTLTCTVQVPLMHATTHDRVLRIPGGVVALASCHRELSLVVVVPDQVDGLATLEAQVVGGALPGWIAEASGHRIEWVLPKMQLYQTDFLILTEHLQALGLRHGGPNDFAGMATPPPGDLQRIQQMAILHKVFLSIDELGMEATAATTLGDLSGSARTAEPVPVHCDRPFLWAICHGFTRSILFIGRVTDPTLGF